MSKTPSKAYDKIIKENLEAIFLPLTELLLGIEIESAKKLAEKLQTTQEREPDFIKEVKTPSGERFILHIEFQSSNESHMVYRMKEYEAILSRKYQIPIKQFVVYMGEGSSGMRTRLTENELFRDFQLINLSSLDAEKLLNQKVPEAIILAVLADFDKSNYEQLFQRIVLKIKQIARDETQLKKYLKQLEVLSKLGEQTTKLIQEMPITYDITTDYLYKKGMEKGMEKGMKKIIQIVQNLLDSESFLSGTLTHEDIAFTCGVPLKQVREIHQKMKKKRKKS